MLCVKLWAPLALCPGGGCILLVWAEAAVSLYTVHTIYTIYTIYTALGPSLHLTWKLFYKLQSTHRRRSQQQQQQQQHNQKVWSACGINY